MLHAAARHTEAPAAPHGRPREMPTALHGRVGRVLGGPGDVADALWDEVAARASGSGPAVAELIGLARDTDGGKRLRPKLVAAAYLAFGGDDRALVRRVAGAQQLVHLALCAHDDLIDGDLVRHGRANAIGAAAALARADGGDADQSERLGTAAAVLVGDLALGTAVGALLTAPASDARRARLALATVQAVERAIAGEYLDVRNELVAPDRSDPLAVARLKTASYSITLPLALGAIAAGIEDGAVHSTIERVGTALGIAYQLGDDDLGLFGAPEITGKSVLSDLRDGKRTEHIRLAHGLANPDDRAALEQTLGRTEATPADLERIRVLVIATGARSLVRGRIRALLDAADEDARAGLPAELAAYLTDLARTLRDRTS
ncbi:polyprenyl synthetase family protein [Agromyces seonyuensis]|uniref:Polyprenyl synthetase family protein n=1 Tax=Agromyces seonyuensis TaxID=2662446 RepID=A0A6I4NZF9_9MICO|nr:polyprenyl synthetase family protein [Agromyces seonyuensis]MWB99706.1 polyprenyl synthetase family protein [Agromyces seonyuensis]